MTTQEQSSSSFPTSRDLGTPDDGRWQDDIRDKIEQWLSDVPHKIEELRTETFYPAPWERGEEVTFRVSALLSDKDFERALEEVHKERPSWRTSQEEIDYAAYSLMLQKRTPYGIEFNGVNSVILSYDPSKKIRSIEVEGTASHAWTEKLEQKPMDSFQIASALDLEDFWLFEQRMRKINLEAGNQLERRTGRTTRMLCSALSAASRGNTIDIISSPRARRQAVLDRLHQMAEKLGIIVQVVESKRGRPADVEFHDPM